MTRWEGNDPIAMYASGGMTCNSKLIYNFHRVSNLDKKNQFLSGLFPVVCLCLSSAGGSVTVASCATAALRGSLDFVTPTQDDEWESRKNTTTHMQGDVCQKPLMNQESQSSHKTEKA